MPTPDKQKPVVKQAPVNFENDYTDKEEKITKKGEQGELLQRRRNRNKVERRLEHDMALIRDDLQRPVQPIGQLMPVPSLLGDYLLTNQIGAGHFSRVFLARRLFDRECFAVKVDSGTTHVDMLSNEATVLRCLNRRGPVNHFPKILHFYRSPACSYIVMTLFGKTLTQLKNESMNQRFAKGTWSRMAVQMLYALKMLHDEGFVHRDFKPDNVMIGSHNDPKRCRVVQLIDFGLARMFAVKVGQKWAARPLRKRIHFVGNVHFCSPNMHLNREQGRKDDLFSLIFTLVHLDSRLPWIADATEAEIMEKKTQPVIYLKGMPKSMAVLVEHLNSIGPLNRPCYDLFFKVFRQVMSSHDATDTDQKLTFELFETPPATQSQIKKESGEEKRDWQDPMGTFMQEDPIGINGSGKMLAVWQVPRPYHSVCPTEEKTVMAPRTREHEMKFGQLKTTHRSFVVAMKEREAEKYNKRNYVREMAESGDTENRLTLEMSVMWLEKNMRNLQNPLQQAPPCTRIERDFI